MVNKIPSTLCWLYDIMLVAGIKYDPRDVTTQEKKVRRMIEEVIVQLTTDTAQFAANPNASLAEEKFTLQFPHNPSMYDLLDKTELSEEEKKNYVTEADILNFKIKKIYPQFASIGGKEGSYKGKVPLEGQVCTCYLKGYCFFTMRAMLYDLSEKMLSVFSKDKMGQVVSSLAYLYLVRDCYGKPFPNHSPKRRTLWGIRSRCTEKHSAIPRGIPRFQKANC